MNEKNVIEAAKAFRQTLEDCANDNTVKGTEQRMNQIDRNRFKQSIKSALMDLMTAIADDSPNIATFINEKAVALRLDNEQLGYITIALDAMVKDLDYDAADEADDYQAKQVATAEKKKLQAEAKAKKMKADAEVRAKKAELRRLKEEAEGKALDDDAEA
jgi:hypothetical protein